jgi:uncharacterized membrane protein YhhN
MAQKNNSVQLLLVPYFVIGLLELVSIIGDFSLLHHFTKPLLMPFLSIFYFILIQRSKVRVSWLIMISLFFSWLGDVFLMYQVKNSIYFMLGLGSFLIAHILYIVCYIKMSNSTPVDKDKRPRLARYIFFLILIWLTLVTVLFPVLGDMKVPVVIYSIAITGMTLAALHRYQKTNSLSFWMVMVGALIFLLSDSMIAINKFLEPIPYANVLIMTTYIIAQYYIISGLIQHQLKS